MLITINVLASKTGPAPSANSPQLANMANAVKAALAPLFGGAGGGKIISGHLDVCNDDHSNCVTAILK